MAVEAKVGNVKTTNTVVKYFKDIKAEFKKITWPSKENIFKTTGIVLSTILIFTLIIWLYDSVFAKILNTVLEYIK